MAPGRGKLSEAGMNAPWEQPAWDAKRWLLRTGQGAVCPEHFNHYLYALGHSGIEPNQEGLHPSSKQTHRLAEPPAQ